MRSSLSSSVGFFRPPFRPSARFLVLIALVLINQFAFAGSATWKASPISGDWNTPANWTPETVPNGSSDTATFAGSNTTRVTISTTIEIAEMVFDLGAGTFQVTLREGGPFVIGGAGITNESGSEQVLSTAYRGYTEWQFVNGATAGSNVSFNNKATGKISFYNTATAGNATFINHEPVLGGAFGAGAITQFFDNATAGTATFINKGDGSSSVPAETLFLDFSSADHGTFINEAGGGPGTGGVTAFGDNATAANGTFMDTLGSATVFSGNATAANATFLKTSGQVIFNTGATAANSTINNQGGSVTFLGGDAGDAIITNTGVSATEFYSGSAGNSTLIAIGDSQYEFGTLILFYGGDGGTARIELFGNGALDISESDNRSTPIGSIEGDGSVYLGSNNLSVGSNNLSTIFTGVLHDGGYASDDPGGSLTKIGTGNLTLTSASTNTGGTTVEEGVLLINNTTGSGTGSGRVQVNGGILGGDGIIGGAVSVGTGQGTEAVIGPGGDDVTPGTLTIQKKLTLKSDATFRVLLNSDTSAADGLVARGVRMLGAQIILRDSGSTILAPGTVFTVIDNTAATTISGNFSNLADGGTITVGSNTFQANYEGGDGNDLTLTVVE